MNTLSRTWVCLGGYDLEMLTIRELLRSRGDVQLLDKQLAWGAKASAYLAELQKATGPALLIELQDDLPPEVPREHLVWIDHHNQLAGQHQPTSLEQVIAYFQFPASAWTRDLALVAANDRGHIPAMLELNATVEELQEIRQRDRAAQGITSLEEEQGREACTHAQQYLAGRLTVVQLPHTRSATVTDTLDARLGGPGYENLLILSPSMTMFFGAGVCIEALKKAYPSSWSGGELPVRGYWGIAESFSTQQLLKLLEPFLI